MTIQLTTEELGYLVSISESLCEPEPFIQNYDKYALLLLIVKENTEGMALTHYKAVRKGKQNVKVRMPYSCAFTYFNILSLVGTNDNFDRVIITLLDKELSKHKSSISAKIGHLNYNSKVIVNN